MSNGMFASRSTACEPLLVLAAVGLHDRDVGALAASRFAAHQVLLALLPLAKRHANRARECDVEGDPELDRLAARRA
jgi:hypothetical protein